MARDEDPTGDEVIAPVTLVVWGIPKKDTQSRTQSQLVGSSGGGVRVTRTSEDTKVVIPRRCTKESVVWCRSWAGSRR
jgi:hypothetical protein